MGLISKTPNIHSRHRIDDFEEWLLVQIGCIRSPVQNFLEDPKHNVSSRHPQNSKFLPPLSWKIKNMAEKRRTKTLISTCDAFLWWIGISLWWKPMACPTRMTETISKQKSWKSVMHLKKTSTRTDPKQKLQPHGLQRKVPQNLLWCSYSPESLMADNPA